MFYSFISVRNGRHGHVIRATITRAATNRCARPITIHHASPPRWQWRSIHAHFRGYVAFAGRHPRLSLPPITEQPQRALRWTQPSFERTPDLELLKGRIQLLQSVRLCRSARLGASSQDQIPWRGAHVVRIGWMDDDGRWKAPTASLWQRATYCWERPHVHFGRCSHVLLLRSAKTPPTIDSCPDHAVPVHRDRLAFSFGL